MTFTASKTMWEMMQSDKYVRLIAGPVGSGKSVCVSHELMKLATQQAPNSEGERKTRTLIVRNTADQLKSTTMKTFFDWFPPGVWGTYRVTDNKTFYVDAPLPDGTRVKAEFMFIALDTPDDVRKALSLEATFLWGNEWRELHPDVVDGLLMRLRRYPSHKDGGPTRSGAIFDTNFPDADTWHMENMENLPDNWSLHVQPPAILSYDEYLQQEGEAPDEDDAFSDHENTRWWVNPRADNVDHLDPLYYRDIIPGKSRDFVDVYLRCRYGRSLSGLPVYEKTFNPEFHVLNTPVVPLKAVEYPIVIGLDFGRTPAAVLMQRGVQGEVFVLEELTSVNMGIETFLDTKLRPLLANKYSGCSFVVAPDPAGFAKQQVGEVSPADIVKNAGFKVVKPVTNDPTKRVLAVEHLLMRHTGGKATFRVVAEQCPTLVKGFKYGYRYKLRRNGVQDDKPDKNNFSHCHDALQYGALVVEGNQLSGQSPFVRREVKRVSAVGWT